MSRPIRLECDREQYHALHVALDKVRKNSRTVTVSKDALAALLRDHARILARLQNGPDYTEEV